MRALVAFALLTGPMFYFGWPSPWWSVPLAFLFGMAGRGPSSGGRRPRRGGYLMVPASPPGKAGTAERVATYTASFKAGMLQGAQGEQRTQADLSRDTAPGASTPGQRSGLGMGGFLGLSADDAATSEGREVFQRYRARLTPAQLAVFDQLHAEAVATGFLATWFNDAMKPHGPWPDPFEDPQ